MEGTTPNAGVSLLDEAHGRRLAGDADGALRRVLAILDAAPQQLGAATLAAELLLVAGRPVVAGEVAGRLVDAYIRRGDLPGAVVAARLADRADEDGAEARRQIAKVFGRGSKRTADVSPAPPPLPSDAEISSALEKTSGDALLDRAEDALQRFLGQDDPVSEDAQVPELPLFSKLKPKALTRLLEALEVRDVSEGEDVITQGDEGREAFVVVRGMLEVVRRAEGDAEPLRLAVLGPGSIVGEMALVSDAPRAASVRAVEPTRLLVAERTQLEAQAADVPAIGEELGAFCRGRMVANLMRHSAILAAVAPAERAELMSRFRTRTFEEGDALVREGDETEGLFLIASGVVEVTGRDADGDPIRLAELGPGDIVGEISLVLRRPATADVVAASTTIALELSRAEFQQAIKDHPTLLNELYDLATRREEETRTVVAQEALDVEDVVIV